MHHVYTSHGSFPNVALPTREKLIGGSAVTQSGSKILNKLLKFRKWFVELKGGKIIEIQMRRTGVRVDGHTGKRDSTGKHAHTCLANARAQVFGKRTWQTHLANPPGKHFPSYLDLNLFRYSS